HPIDPPRQPLRPFLPAMHKHLSIRMVRSKVVAPALKIRPEFGVIVDLPIENRADLSVFVPHRLMPRCDVNDRQPPMPEKDTDGFVDEKTIAVRPTMRQRSGHALQILPRSGAYEPNNTAHFL